MKKSILIFCFLSIIGAISAQAQTTIYFNYDNAGNRIGADYTGYSTCETSIHIQSPLTSPTDLYYSDFIRVEAQIQNSAQNVNLIAGNYVLADQDFEVPLGVQAFLNTELRECLCYDGIDNDLDGLADSLDPDCQ